MRDTIVEALTTAAQALATAIANPATLAGIEAAAETIIEAMRRDGIVLSCGNGGSLCDAAHLAEELTGRFRRNRPPFRALAINDPGHLTCVANDFGFDEVFARAVDAHGRRGDVLVAISTSGQSANVVNAALRARARGMAVIALTGRAGSRLAQTADVEICTLAPSADRVQELHIKVIHILVELVERALVPENYEDA